MSVLEPSFLDKPKPDTELAILQKILEQQQEQTKLLRKIRWTIFGFAGWFIIQSWILPKIMASFQ
jgi:hypothetical protein